MEIKILSNEKKVLEFEVDGCEQSILNNLAERLNKKNDVEFAAYKVDHPIVGSPKMIVKTKKGNPLDLVLEELESLGDEIATFRKEFKNAVK